MADENAKIDRNNRPSLTGVDSVTGEIRPVLVDEFGRVLAIISGAGGGGGDVNGPGTSTDNALAVWDGTDGTLLQDSTVLISDVLVSSDIGTTIQGYNANLADIAGLTLTTGDLLVGNVTADIVILGAGTENQVLTVQGDGSLAWETPGGGSGDVVGPASSTDHAIARFQSTTGKEIQNSGVIIDDSDNVTGVNNVTGADTNFVTGTAGTNGNVVAWNVDGDAVDGGVVAANILVDGDIGVSVQAYSARLTDVAALTPTDSNFIVGNGSTWVAESGSTVRTSLGLGSLAVLNSINNTNWSGEDLSVANGGTGASTLTGLLQGNGTSAITGGATINNTNWSGEDLSVANGGTGVSSLTAYAVICGGTTSTGAVQSVSGVGTSGQVLTSNGAGALPTWEDAGGGGGTPRRNLGIMWVITSLSKAGVNPIQAGGGIRNEVTASDTGSVAKFTVDGASTAWEFYDRSPEFDFNLKYRTGYDTGNGEVWVGDTADTFNPSRTQTAKSMFLMMETVSGTSTAYLVNANGSSNTNTALTGITFSIATTDWWTIKKNSTTNIKIYYNFTLKATHTTNLPSGDSVNDAFFLTGVNNASGDSTSRCIDVYGVAGAMDSPNS